MGGFPHPLNTPSPRPVTEGAAREYDKHGALPDEQRALVELEVRFYWTMEEITSAAEQFTLVVQHEEHVYLFSPSDEPNKKFEWARIDLSLIHI